ncbi:MAG: erythromycin esterase family protein [Firmicutes bacterium]|nr:erythromycin esterase family protein [Bacillota bacterium]
MKLKIKLLISLLIITLITGCSIDTTKKVSKEEDIYSYLKNNHSLIDVDSNDFTDLNMINTDGKKIILTGENHGVKGNVKLRKKFLKYFKEKTDFKYYLCEISFSTAYFINKYLETGNEDILKKVYAPLKGTYEWNKDNYNHWIKLFKYNKTLPKDRKIKVVGIDIEHQPINAFRYMYSVLPKKKAPGKINKILNEFNDILSGKKKLDNEGLKEFCERLNNDIEKNKDVYKDYLKDDYFGFNLVNKNIIYRYEVYESNKFNVLRDEKMYENFKKVYNNLNDGKYFGQWGLNHIFQENQMDVNWLATFIDNDDRFKNKVLSIAYVYDDSIYMEKRNGYSTEKIDTFNSNMDFGFIKNFTLLKLNSKGSPFKQRNIWPFSHTEKGENPTTEYFQYLVVVKNAKPTEPLN